jgi:3-hydroxyacyl-CoA dehydrogenase/enoyl-CoA hydratase/3-hydroxybutyryl-CoA epimerase
MERERPAGVVFASAKPRNFVAGADLFEIRAMDDAALDEYLRKGQEIYDRIASLPMPTVAAINGDCLGGGLELALACKSRVAVNEPQIQIGLPETKLGLIPGWGGTIRLPRLIGVAPALKLMLAGKSLSPSDALSAAIVDEVVQRDQLLSLARQRAQAPAPTRHSAVQIKDLREIFANARAETRARSGDNYPALQRLIDVVETGYEQGANAAAAAERRGLIELRSSPAGKNLMRLFFLRTSAKKQAAAEVGAEPSAVKSAAVIGGGTMGAGIVHALVGRGIPVQLVESDDRAAQAARSRVQKLLEQDVMSGSLSSASGAEKILTVSTDINAASRCDLIVEAIVEQKSAKIDLLRRIDAIIPPQSVLASNTSSLSIGELAQATVHPQRVIGLHFFNPVAKMPLVEVVRAPQTDRRALATGVAVAAALGKTPVVVNDAPGFVVNRVLFPYLHEALAMLSEGADPADTDASMKRWGMPMGPFELVDEIGLDVTRMILQSLEQSLGPRFSSPGILDRAIEHGWLGKKSGAGFYRYSSPGSSLVNSELLPAQRHTLSDEKVQKRLMDTMAAEARKLLAEKVVESPDAIDLATVLGLGFAPFRGGLARFAGLS